MLYFYDTDVMNVINTKSLFQLLKNTDIIQTKVWIVV